ncbi:MAG: hypothetical protein IPQ06_15770 [Chitinophagaceae bacterium]|nr:hypothetical protein [Chitinophagaceae bacterium]
MCRPVLLILALGIIQDWLSSRTMAKIEAGALLQKEFGDAGPQKVTALFSMQFIPQKIFAYYSAHWKAIYRTS